MEKKSIKNQEIFVSEEEKILVWESVKASFEKNFGSEIYSSWLKNVSLLKEYNDAFSSDAGKPKLWQPDNTLVGASPTPPALKIADGGPVKGD